MTSPPLPPAAINIAVLRGTVSSVPAERELASGEVVVQFDVATLDGALSGRASTPISWSPPRPSANRPDKGEEVLVVGWMRRRFFRAGGATQSRTEVVAEQVIAVRRARAVAKALAEVAERIQSP